MSVTRWDAGGRGPLRHLGSALCGAAPSSTCPNERVATKRPFRRAALKHPGPLTVPAIPPPLGLRGAGTGPASDTALQRPRCAAAPMHADVPRRGAAGLKTAVTAGREGFPAAARSSPCCPRPRGARAVPRPQEERHRAPASRPPPPPRGRQSAESPQLSPLPSPLRVAAFPAGPGSAADRARSHGPSPPRTPHAAARPGPAALAASRPRDGPARDVTA